MALATMIVAAGIIALVGQWVRRTAVSQALAAARARTDASAGLFRSELEKFRLLPLVLSENTDVIAALHDRKRPVLDQLNVKLKSLADHTGVAVIYVLDRSGTAIASSNYDRPESFIDRNYSFRTYFRDALGGVFAEHFALGTISRRPGLFIARRVSGGEGVVVAKIDFDELERRWATQPGATIVRNRPGIVTAASNPAWRLHASRPLPRDPVQEERRRLQFGVAIPPRLPFYLPTPTADGEIVKIGSSGTFAVASTNVTVRHWTLSTLEPLAPALLAAKTRAWALGLATMLALVLLSGLVLRAFERRRLLLRSQRELEDKVRDRTAELSRANARLIDEVAEREQASRRLRKARDELAQANRLGSLGQIAAGVAHEINQPVAAIHTLAENARVLLARAEAGEVDFNLETIIGLSNRIGLITGELRAFARRETPVLGPVRLGDALDGALLLLGERLRLGRVRLAGIDEIGDATVVADRMRLEQVIINLLQNAVDAMIDTEAPCIQLSLAGGEGELALTVDDNGSGIPVDQQGSIFQPFVTDKPTGLGLGLGIAQEIMREFGGELALARSSLGGAAFTMTLRPA